MAQTALSRAAVGPDKLVIPQQSVVVGSGCEHLGAGADHVLVQPLAGEGLAELVDQQEELAPHLF